MVAVCGIQSGLKPTSLRALQQNASQRKRISIKTYSMASSAPEMKEIDPQTTGKNVQSSSGTASTSSRSTPVSYRVSFFDAMKFAGPAPERINARLAMLFGVYAAQREHTTGLTLLQQLTNPEWPLIALAAVIVYATMVPVLRGVKDEDFFMFSVKAEKLNGRLAMLGWAGLLAVEELYAHACFF